MLIFLCSISFVFSQEQETLFGGGDIIWGGYGGPEIKFTSVNNSTAIMVGGRGGAIINHTFTIGLGGYGLVTSHKLSNYKIADPLLIDSLPYLRVGYGGLDLGMALESNKLIHITGNILIGAGGASYTSAYQHSKWDNYDNKTYKSSAFFVIEPRVGVELNVIKFMRLEASGSYRFISGLDLPATSNEDISGASINLIFKFGKF